MTENRLGVVNISDNTGDIEDDYRICFLLEHISELKKAILEDHVDYIGYFTWSRVDL